MMWGGMCWDVRSWVCPCVPVLCARCKASLSFTGRGLRGKTGAVLLPGAAIPGRGMGQLGQHPPCGSRGWGSSPRAAGRVGRAAPTAPQLRISGCSAPSAVNPSRCVFAQQPQDYFLSKGGRRGQLDLPGLCTAWIPKQRPSWNSLPGSSELPQPVSFSAAGSMLHWDFGERG